jgi:hypothetical protein
MSYHLPERKSEQAFRAYFGVITGLAVRTRFSGAEKSLPELVIICDECGPAVRGESQEVLEWACDLKFTIRSRYIKDDQATGEAHDTFVGAIGDMIADATIITGLNQFSALLEFQAVLWKPGTRKSKVTEHDLETELSGTLWLVPSAAQ